MAKHNLERKYFLKEQEHYKKVITKQLAKEKELKAKETEQVKEGRRLAMEQEKQENMNLQLQNRERKLAENSRRC